MLLYLMKHVNRAMQVNEEECQIPDAVEQWD
jgi:hypothetical protein